MPGAIPCPLPEEACLEIGGVAAPDDTFDVSLEGWQDDSVVLTWESRADSQEADLLCRQVLRPCCRQGCGGDGEGDGDGHSWGSAACCVGGAKNGPRRSTQAPPDLAELARLAERAPGPAGGSSGCSCGSGRALAAATGTPNVPMVSGHAVQYQGCAGDGPGGSGDAGRAGACASPGAASSRSSLMTSFSVAACASGDSRGSVGSSSGEAPPACGPLGGRLPWRTPTVHLRPGGRR